MRLQYLRAFIVLLAGFVTLVANMSTYRCNVIFIYCFSCIDCILYSFHACDGIIAKVGRK